MAIYSDLFFILIYKIVFCHIFLQTPNKEFSLCCDSTQCVMPLAKKNSDYQEVIEGHIAKTETHLIKYEDQKLNYIWPSFSHNFL
jgi:hypothetical protein